MATERSLGRCGADRFDCLLLHNPDRIGYSSEHVWNALVRLRDEGLADGIGIAPGPANGFTLDVIRCLERFGPLIDWTMLILNPLEPWPGQLVLPVCAKHDVQVLARVVDYGGIFHDDLRDADQLRDGDHRAFRPLGWVDSGRARMEQMRPIAERHGLSMLQLACQWTLAQQAVVQRGADADPGARRRRAHASSRSAPTWQRCRARSCSRPTRWPRSRRSATTPGRWR